MTDRRPDLPMFLIDCTRPLDDQLTPGQLAWVKQWAESNECHGCGLGAHLGHAVHARRPTKEHTMTPRRLSRRRLVNGDRSE